MDGGVANNTPISRAVELGAEPCPLSIQPIDFAHADELLSRALEDAREFLDADGEERPPIQMRMHRHALASR
jgi:hypothetical protein